MFTNASILLKNLCCSRCKADFAPDSIQCIQKEKNYYVVKLTCQKCGKDFGISFLKIGDETIKSKDEKISLKSIKDFPPISYDDVIDAHRYIKDFEQNWKEFINED